MVERWPFKPMVVGSIPTEGAFFDFGLSLFVWVKDPSLFLFTFATVAYTRLGPGLGHGRLLGIVQLHRRRFGMGQGVLAQYSIEGGDKLADRL